MLVDVVTSIEIFEIRVGTDMNYEFYYEQLSTRERDVYRLLVGVLNRQCLNVQIGRRMSEQSMRMIIQAIDYDHPEFWCIDFSKIKLRCYGSASEITFYLSDSAKHKMTSVNLDKRVGDICDMVRSGAKSQYELCQRLHDYLVQNIAYDDAAVCCRESTDSFTAIGVFFNHVAVCEGFAKAFKLMCDHVGVESIVLTGRSLLHGADTLHAWNAVRINGEWTCVDVTWDRKASEVAKVVRYDYFLGKFADFRRDHDLSSEIMINSTGRAVDYFTSANALVATREDLVAHLTACDRRGSKTYYFKVRNYYADYSALVRTIDEIVIAHLQKICMFGFDCRTVHNPSQQIFFYSYKKMENTS